MTVLLFGFSPSQPENALKLITQAPGKSAATVSLTCPESSDTFEIREPASPVPSKQAEDEENIETAWADLGRMADKLIPKRVRFQEPTQEIPLGWWQTLKINREAFSDLKLARTEVNQQMKFLQQDAENYLNSGPTKQAIDSVAKNFLGPAGQKEQKIVHGGLTRLLNGTGSLSPKTIAKDVQTLVELRHQSLPDLHDALEEAWQDWEVQDNKLLNMGIGRAQQALYDYQQALEQLLP